MAKQQVSGLEFDFLTTAEIFALTPVNNEIRFNSDDGFYYMYNGSVWRRIELGDELLLTHFEETFESGSFVTNGWVLVNGGENDWVVGTAAKASGTYGAYISNNGGTSNQYSSIGGGLDVSHFYKDIVIPAGPLNNLVLEFDWRCEAEVGFDWMRVFNAPTSITPVANSSVSTAYRVGANNYNNQATFINEQIPLDTAQAGTTRRIIFSWRNDSSVENQPPAALDNIKLLYD